MIEVRNIRKSFGSLEVLKGIDLDIRKGEVVSIVGPSGAGKTTLLQIMGTLDKPDSGSVRLDGVAMESLSRKEMADFRNRRVRVSVPSVIARVHGTRKCDDSGVHRACFHK